MQSAGRLAIMLVCLDVRGAVAAILRGFRPGMESSRSLKGLPGSSARNAIWLPSGGPLETEEMHGSKCELLRCAAIGPHPPQGSLGKPEISDPLPVPGKEIGRASCRE